LLVGAGQDNLSSIIIIIIIIYEVGFRASRSEITSHGELYPGCQATAVLLRGRTTYDKAARAHMEEKALPTFPRKKKKKLPG
jgi:hypothetical protein